VEDQRLAGSMGNGGNIIRRGDVVIRPAGPHAEASSALLTALASTSFSAPVPSSRAFDDGLAFSWIEGDVPVRPFPAWSMKDEALSSAGRLLREYHAVIAEVSLPASLSWSDELADPEGGPIICHNDLCPENVVFRDGNAGALLDFDFAAPGRPIWDLAHMARMWCPLRPPDMVADGMRDLDPFHRLGVLARSYGLAARDRTDFVEAIVASRHVGDRFLRQRLKAGEPAFVQAWAPLGGEQTLDRILLWLTAQRSAMLAAVS
jgi:hypothetical protein